MSNPHTTTLINQNKQLIVGYIHSTYKTYNISFMNNNNEKLDRQLHGGAHISVCPFAEKSGVNNRTYYYVSNSIYIHHIWNVGDCYCVSIRDDQFNNIQEADDKYHFLFVGGRLGEKTFIDVTLKDLCKWEFVGFVDNQTHNKCRLYKIPEGVFLAKKKYDWNVKDFDFTQFRPETIGNVKYVNSYYKGWFCIDFYNDQKELALEGAIKGRSYGDLYKQLLQTVSSNKGGHMDCSSSTAFRNKVKHGRDVEIVLKDGEEEKVVYARIRELEKEVDDLKKRVTELENVVYNKESK